VRLGLVRWVVRLIGPIYLGLRSASVYSSLKLELAHYTI
jgi:hypothetical protein